MRHQLLVASVLTSLIAIPVGAGGSASANRPPVTAGATGFAVPKATCGPGSLPETGLQGQVPIVDQADGRAMQGYRCNLALVGQYAADGGALMEAWHGDCAYMATGYAATDPEFEQRKGVVVIDASDPAHPKETARLQSVSMVNTWESLKANATRGLLAAGQGGSFPPFGPGSSGPGFDVYDVEKDCRHPVLQASATLPNGHGHEGDFAPDGNTYYQSTLSGAPSTSIVAIDVRDPKHPTQLAAFTLPNSIHAVQISDDGLRGYFMATGAGDGLEVYDLSEVQRRRPHPQIHLIGQARWADNSLAQIARSVRIGGRPYVITTDEQGAALNPTQACAQGVPPWGFSRIIDMADERHPKVVSTIKLEVNDPANCATTLQDQNSGFSLMYSSHYCTADDPHNTTAIACGWISSGVRVFDVRDPLHPREIAYYNPPARIDTARGTAPFLSEAFIGSRTKDGVFTQIRWKKDARGHMNLWFISVMNGFQVVDFTNGAYPLSAALAAAPPRATVTTGQARAAVGSTSPGLAATGTSSTGVWLSVSLMLLCAVGIRTARRASRA